MCVGRTHQVCRRRVYWSLEPLFCFLYAHFRYFSVLLLAFFTSGGLREHLPRRREISCSTQDCDFLQQNPPSILSSAPPLPAGDGPPSSGWPAAKPSEGPCGSSRCSNSPEKQHRQPGTLTPACRGPLFEKLRQHRHSPYGWPTDWFCSARIISVWLFYSSTSSEVLRGHYWLRKKCFPSSSSFPALCFISNFTQKLQHGRLSKHQALYRPRAIPTSSLRFPLIRALWPPCPHTFVDPPQQDNGINLLSECRCHPQPKPVGLLNAYAGPSFESFLLELVFNPLLLS